ncbi:MAG: hypothetical protein WC450_02400, partial [Candidatus Omnitrophota bacterium]
MKKILIFMVIIANIVSVCIASANEDSQIKKYHLDQYPGIGELFHWGMNVRDIEKVLNQSLPNIGKDKYQAAFSTGELKMNAVFVVTDKGLEALALQFDIVAEEYSRLLAHLKDIYGDPSGVDAEMGAMQWKDEVNDTGAVIMGEKEGVYSVVVGLRLLRDRVAIKGLEPGKISSLEGVTLG